jgi:hypothetical protein
VVAVAAVAATTTRDDGQQQHDNQHDNQYNNNMTTTTTMNIAAVVVVSSERGRQRGGTTPPVCVSCLSTGKSRPFDILRTIESCASYLPHLTSLTHEFLAIGSGVCTRSRTADVRS